MTGKDNSMKNLLRGCFSVDDSVDDSGDVKPDCPPEEVFHDLVMNRLSDQRMAEVEEHLCHCDRCLQTLIALADLRTEAPADQVCPAPAAVLDALFSRIPRGKPVFSGLFREQIMEKCRSVYRAFMDLFSPGTQEFVYVRGRRKVVSGNLVVLEKVFKEIKLQIEIEKVRQDASDIKVFTRHPDTEESIEGVRLGLLNIQRELASCMAVRGEALFENLPFGWYKLTVRKAGQNLGEVILRIKE